MFGYSSYLDKSMTGIKTITDGVALIQNGNATFNTINVETITSSNLTDCNLTNCTTNDPTSPQSVANKEYCDDNFVDRTNNLMQNINGLKTFTNNIRFNGNAQFYATNSPFTNRTSFEQLSTALNITPIHGNGTLSLRATNAAGTAFSMISISNTGSTFSGTISCGTLRANQTANPQYIYDNLTTGGTINFGTSGCNNNIKGPTTFLSVPLCSVTALIDSELVNFKTLNSQNFTTLSLVQSNPNVWINTNTFNMSLPTSTITATTNYELVNFFTLNNQNFTTLALVQNNNNSWTGTNTFNSSLPTSTITPSSSYELVNFKYVNDTFQLKTGMLNFLTLSSAIIIYQAKSDMINYLTTNSATSIYQPKSDMINYVSTSGVQSINGIKTFGSLPECNINPSSQYQLVNKNYVDSLPLHQTVSGLINYMSNYVNTSGAQIINGIKTFGSLPECNINPNSQYQLVNKNYVDSLPLHQTVSGLINYLSIYQTKSDMINYMTISGDQLITGVKTFHNFPRTATPLVAPTQDSQFVHKFWTDAMYLKQSNAVITYLTISSAILTYQPLNLMSNYLTTASATSIYQPISLMSNYLTTSSATSTYQPISLMSNYLTTATATTTYQPKSDMINYLTTATATLTYQPKTDMINYVSTTGPQNINGLKTFGTLPECSNGSPSLDNQLVNKFYVDRLPIHFTVSGIVSNLSIYQLKSDMINYLTISSAISTYARLATSNTFTNNLISNGQTTFNNFTPICTVSAPTAINHLTRKNYVDDNFMFKTGNVEEAISGYKKFNNRVDLNGGTALVVGAGSSSFSGTVSLNAQTTFNNNAPISNTTPTLQNHLTTKNYVDNNFLTISSAIAIYATKSYVDSMPIHGILNSTNAWTGSNSFNTNLPTSTITATTANQLVNFTTLNGQSFVKSSSSTSFTGNNIFQVYTTFRAALYLQDSLTATKTGDITLQNSGILTINNNTANGSINFGSSDAGGANYSRATINENEFNFEVPITLNLFYTYYNPALFSSTRLGYTTTNTGSTNGLTSGTGNNSGQLNLPAGSWNITYTGTITITGTDLLSLTSLEMFIANSFNQNLNINGLNTLNYYKITDIPNGQKIKISGSGNITNYISTNTEFNLRLIPIFSARAGGGMTFQGSISATRNA
jgi:hypothetical protein